jgi:hypothetical protein
MYEYTHIEYKRHKCPLALFRIQVFDTSMLNILFSYFTHRKDDIEGDNNEYYIVYAEYT